MFKLILSLMFSRQKSLGPIGGIVLVLVVLFSGTDHLSVILPFVPIAVTGFLALKFLGLTQTDKAAETLKAWGTHAASRLSASGPDIAPVTVAAFAPTAQASSISMASVPKVVRQDVLPVSDTPIAAPDMTALERARQGVHRSASAARSDPRARFKQHIEEQRARLAKGH